MSSAAFRRYEHASSNSPEQLRLFPEDPFQGLEMGLRKFSERVLAVSGDDREGIFQILEDANTEMAPFRNQLLLLLRNTSFRSQQIDELVEQYNVLWDSLRSIESLHKIVRLIIRDIYFVPKVRLSPDGSEMTVLEEEGIEDLPTKF